MVEAVGAGQAAVNTLSVCSRTQEGPLSQFHVYF